MLCGNFSFIILIVKNKSALPVSTQILKWVPANQET